MSRRRTFTHILDHSLTLDAAALLVGVVAAPAYFNILSSRSFEPDKGALLHSLAAVIGLALLPAAWRLARARAWPSRSALRLSAWLLLLIAVVGVAATIFSIDPVTSFWGNHERGFGLLSLLAGLMFLLAAFRMVRAGHLWLLIDAALIGAFVPVLYGLSQLAGYDPVVGRTVSFELGQRASSSLGNPLFLADYLLLTLLLALARRFLHPPALRSSRLVLDAYLLVVLLAFVATQSRSALLAVLVSGTFLLLYWGYLRTNRTVRLLGFGVLAAGALLILLAWTTPQLLPQRLGDLFASGGSGGQRLLFWQAILDLLRAEPRYLLTGLGFDALPLRLGRYLPAALAHYEVDWAFRIPDRAHSLPWDLLSQGGVFYLALWTGLWAALGAALLPRHPRRPWLPLALQMLGALIGAVAASLLVGPPSASLGLSMGLLGGALLALLITPAGATSALSTAPELAPFLLAALMGHWTMLSFSFSTHAPDLLMWVIIGMVIALTTPEEQNTRGRRQAGASSMSSEHIKLGGIAFAVFCLSTASAWQASLPLWIAALIFLYMLAFYLSPKPADSARAWYWFFAPVLMLVPAIVFNTRTGAGAWLAYAWFLLWLLAQSALLLPTAARKTAPPVLAAAIPIILLLNLPQFGDIAYKTALLNSQNQQARRTWLSRALALNPHDHIIASGMAFVESKALGAEIGLDDPAAQRVQELYETAIQAQPLAPEPPAFYAEWLGTRVNLDDDTIALAETYFDQTLSLAPGNLQALNGRALLRWRTGNQQEALLGLRALLDLDPLYGPAYLNLAEIQRQSGDVEGARETLEVGVAEVPWWDELANALDRLSE